MELAGNEEEAKALLKDVFIGHSDYEDGLSVSVPTLKKVFHKYTSQLHRTGGWGVRFAAELTKDFPRKVAVLGEHTNLW